MVEIDVITAQVEGFGVAQPSHRNQPEQAVVSPAAQGVRWRQSQCRGQQSLDLGVIVDIRLRPSNRWYAVRRRHLRQGIEVCDMLGEAAHVGQANSPAWLPSDLRDPLHGQRHCDGLRAASFHEADKIRQPACRTVIFIPQALSHANVALERVPKQAHCTPPGQGWLSVRSFSISSLA